MHILLTDRLSCPRCGPEFGLILLADRVEDRRVYAGTLGCPNCRDRFPVVDGFGDLRAPPRTEIPAAQEDAAPDPAGAADGAEAAETEKVAALLGVAEGPGHVALVGPVARRAGALADLLGDIEVVAVDAAMRSRPERTGVSRLLSRPGLPFFSRTFRGVALSGEATERFLDEGTRVVAPMGRVVALDAGPETRGRLEAAGLEVVLDDSGVVVARR